MENKSNKNRLSPDFEDASQIKSALNSPTTIEEKYRILLESIEEGFCTIEVLFDENGKAVDYIFLEVNPAFERHAVIKDVIGKRIRTLFPNLEDFWFNVYGEVILTGKPQRFEHYGAETNRFYDVYAFRIGAPEDRKVGIIFSNISKRKRAEEELEKSEKQLQMILESTKDYAIITFNLEGKITRFNRGAENLFGYTEQEIIGQDGEILFTPGDRAKKIPQKEIETALKNGSAKDERCHLRKDGSRFYASGVMHLLKNGETEGFVKIARDETQRLATENAQREKEMLRRLIVSQEDERRRIARDIHDHFGQQMTALRLKLAKVKEMNLDESLLNQIEAVEEIAANLDSDIDFITWELRPAALDDLGLRIAIGNFLKEWSHHTGIKSEYHISGVGENHFSYEVKTNLYRIAQEALNNIYKHAQAKRVEVILEKRGNELSLVIEDNGIGFDVEDKENRQKGIGLIGIHERATALGGTAEIESKKGSGTTVYVRVPIKFEE